MLQVLRMTLGTAARRHGADENLVEDIKMGAAEAVAEAIEAHRTAHNSEPVTVELDFTETFAVRVTYMQDGQRRRETIDSVDRVGVIAGIADEVNVEHHQVGTAAISMRWGQAGMRP